MKLTTENWPILIVSNDWKQANDNGFRLRELERNLQEVEGCKVIPSFTGLDALDIFYSRADLGTIVIDWDEQQQKIKPLELLEDIRKRNYSSLHSKSIISSPINALYSLIYSKPLL